MLRSATGLCRPCSRRDPGSRTCVAGVSRVQPSDSGLSLDRVRHRQVAAAFRRSALLVPEAVRSGWAGRPLPPREPHRAERAQCGSEAVSIVRTAAGRDPWPLFIAAVELCEVRARGKARRVRAPHTATTLGGVFPGAAPAAARSRDPYCDMRPVVRDECSGAKRVARRRRNSALKGLARLVTARSSPSRRPVNAAVR